jgi:hypothetical protein
MPQTSLISFSSTQNSCSAATSAIQSTANARGRLTKRPQADNPPFQASDNDCFGENGDYSLKPLRKRFRKAF